MPLTRNFNETILARIERDVAFREKLLKEGVECLLPGGVDTGRAELIKYVDATTDGQELGANTSNTQACASS